MKTTFITLLFLSSGLMVHASGTDVLTISTTTDYTNLKNITGTFADNQGVSNKLADYDITIFGAQTPESAASRTPFGSIVYWKAMTDDAQYFTHDYIQLISASSGTDQPEDAAFPKYMVVTSKGNHPFRFGGFTFYTENNAEKIHVEAFRKGVLKGSVSLSLPKGSGKDGFDHHPTFGSSDFPANVFGVADEIRISKEMVTPVILPGSTNVFNDFTFQPAGATINESADNTSVISDLSSELCDISLIRTLVHGQWNTLCVPFDISSSTISSVLGNVNIQKLSSSTSQNGDVKMMFTKSTDIKAGVPYLIWPYGDTDIINPTFTDVRTMTAANTPSETDFITFTGVINPYALTLNDRHYYFLSGDGKKLTYATSGAAMKGLRGYFTVKGDVGAKSFTLSFDDSATGIDAVITSPSNSDGNTDGYNEAGMKVKDSYRGLIIKKGKKFINK